MSLVTIATTYNEPLEATQAHIDDKRYDIHMIKCRTPGQPKLDLSDQLRRFNGHFYLRYPTEQCQ